MAGHDEPRAEREHGRGDDRQREHARERLTAALPEREAREQREHGADVADLLGEVVAAEAAGRGRAATDGRSAVTRVGHEQIGEVELEAAAADAERIGMRQRDPQVRGLPRAARARTRARPGAGSGRAARARSRASARGPHRAQKRRPAWPRRASPGTSRRCPGRRAQAARRSGGRRARHAGSGRRRAPASGSVNTSARLRWLSVSAAS